MAVAVTKTTAVAVQQPPPMALLTPDSLMAVAEIMYRGGVGQGKNANEVACKILAGMEIGLRPVQACNNIMLVNGRAVIWGDAALALIRASGKLLSIEERIDGHGDDRVAVCVTHRAGDAEPKEARFSVADAKLAGLWGGGKTKSADSPWVKYPERMLTMRARTWCVRDNFGDILSGLGIAEEAIDTRDAARQVEVVQVVQVADTAPPPKPSATPPVAIEYAPGHQPVSEDVLAEDVLARIIAARFVWLRSQGIDGKDPAQKFAVSAAWAAKLATYQATSARHLNGDQAADLLADLEAAAHVQEVTEIFTPDAVPGAAIETGGVADGTGFPAGQEPPC